MEKKKTTTTESNTQNVSPQQQQVIPPKQENENVDATAPKAKKKSKKKIKKIDPALYINLTVPELCKNILNLAKDQAGCRHIQTKIDEDPDNTIPIYFFIFSITLSAPPPLKHVNTASFFP